MTDTLRIQLESVHDLARDAAEACGADSDNAASLASSIVAAEAEGKRSLGLSHLLDYCEALLAGRIDGQARPLLSQPSPLLWRADARSGMPHLAFDQVFPELVAAARQYGMALFALRNGYTCGALGYFVGRLAAKGLVALAAANAGPAALAAAGGHRPVFGTNPLAFAVPGREGPALLIDQSSTMSAWVNIRDAAERGEALPEGWAVDAEGRPTTDPRSALAGAQLAFGGYKGGNIALMVEMLAAGLTGASWSCDAPSFAEGASCPGTGLLITVIDPAAAYGEGFERRLEAYLRRFVDDYGARVPGARAMDTLGRRRDGVAVPRALIDRLRAYRSGHGSSQGPDKDQRGWPLRA